MYVCTETDCRRSFKRPEHLSRHRLNHNPRKIHQCHVCSKDFVRLDLLQRHMRRHSKGMAYRNSGGYSTRGRSSIQDVLEVPGSEQEQEQEPELPSSNISETVELRGQVPESEPCQDTPKLAERDVLPTPRIGSFRPVTGLDGIPDLVPPGHFPMGSQRHDAEHHSFFEVTYDISGLSQDLDWLFSSINPWDATNDLYSVDRDLTLSSPPTSIGSRHIPASLDQVGENTFPRDRILLALISLPAQVFESSFFETQNLEQFMQTFWTSYNPHFSLLHKPTFSVQDAPPLLLVALLTLGATLSPDPEHYRVAEQIHDSLRWLIFTSSSFRVPAPLWVIQALLITQSYEKMFSTRRLHEMSHIFHYSIVTLMRRGSCYSPNEDIGDMSSLEKAWHRWVERELSHRAAFFAFVMDAQHSSIFGHSAAINLTDIQLPLPCADSLWEAPTAVDWHRERAKVQPCPLFLPALRALLSQHPIPHTYSPFARFVLLHGLFSLTRHMITRDQTASCISTKGSETRQQTVEITEDEDPSPTPEPDNWRDRMDRAIDTWSFSLLSQTPSLCLEAARPLQRIAHLSIYVSLVDFHVLAGAPNLSTGVRATQDSIQYANAHRRISQWAHSRNVNRVLKHCLLLIQETMFTRARYIAAEDNIILRPWVLYNTVLVLWAFGAITAISTTNTVSAEWTAEEYLSYMLNALMGDGDLSRLQAASNISGLIRTVHKSLENCRWELLEEARETLGRILSQRILPLPTGIPRVASEQE